MKKITVENPVVELDGDEMTRIIWHCIRDKLIHPYLDIELGITNFHSKPRRDDDRITVEAANAIKKQRRWRQMRHHHSGRSPGRRIQAEANVGIAERHDPQYSRRRDLPRAQSGQDVPRLVPGWTRPIVIGRHAFGDHIVRPIYEVPGKGRLFIEIRGDDGTIIERKVYAYPGPGISLAMYNLDESYRDFARASMNFGLMHNIQSIYRRRIQF